MKDVSSENWILYYLRKIGINYRLHIYDSIPSSNELAKEELKQRKDNRVMININPIHNIKQVCFDDVIATVASYYKRDYQMMLMDTWGFGFAPPDDLGKGEFGFYLDMKSHVNLSNLEKYHGIKISYNNDEDFNIAIRKAKKEITTHNPVCVHMDSFWCPWDKNYKIYHNSGHYIIVTYINDEVIYCVDPFYEVQNGSVALDNLYQGCFGYTTFKISNNMVNINWIDELLQSITFLDFQEMSKDMFRFAEYIEKVIDYDMEMQPHTSFWHSPLIFKMGRVALGRLRYTVALEYLASKFNVNELIPIIGKLEKVAEKWNAARSLLLKGLTSGDINHVKVRAADMVRTIANDEGDIFSDIIDLLNNAR